MKRILCAVCISLLSWQALAGEVEDKLKTLEVALQKGPKEQEKSPTGSEPRQWPDYNAKVMTGLTLLRQQLASNRVSNAIGTLDGFHEWPLSEEARKGVDELLDTLRKDLDARIKTAQAPSLALKKRAIDEVKKAKSPPDLDIILEELNKAKNLHDIQLSDVTVNNRGSVEQTYAFVAKWQEFLAAKAGGYNDDARAIAKTLADSPAPLLPRSELLAKAYERKTAADSAAPASQPGPTK